MVGPSSEAYFVMRQIFEVGLRRRRLNGRSLRWCWFDVALFGRTGTLCVTKTRMSKKRANVLKLLTDICIVC